MVSETGTTIRELRRKSRMPLQEVSALMGISNAWLSTFERGFAPPPELHVLEKLLTAIGHEEAIPTLLEKAARERGSVTLDLTNASAEAVALAVDLSRMFDRGVHPETATHIRKELPQVG